jgi:phage baseplate assembly protein W
MRDLQLAGGDLVTGTGGFTTVTGTDYLRQRIALALGEPYGDDPYNPAWGSMLPSYIGGPQDSGTDALVSSEVSRVLQLVMDAQQNQIAGWALTGSRSQYAAADVIASVESVSATSTWDTVSVTLTLTTQAGTQLTLTRTVTGT